MELTLQQAEQICRWMREAGQIPLHNWDRAQVTIKADQSPVTNLEYQIEDFFTERLRAFDPDSQLITEEHGVLDAPNRRTWAIDPIDGTRAYLGGLPSWGISLGLMAGGEPEAGFFYMPATDDLIWAYEGGAYWNDRPLTSPQHVQFDGPVGFIGVPSDVHMYYHVDYHQVRSLGSTAAHMAYLARGSAVGMITVNASIWDIAGLLPVLRHTGMAVEYLSGGLFQPADGLDGKKIRKALIMALPPILPQLRRCIQPCTKTDSPQR